MSAVPLSDDARRFLLAKIPTIPHLEALLLVRERAAPWSAAELAKRLYIDKDRAAALIEHLATAGLVACEDGACRYAPADSSVADLVDAIAASYTRNTVLIARLIHAHAETKAQRFADAFRLHKEP